jgi:hypothetical protein
MILYDAVPINSANGSSSLIKDVLSLAIRWQQSALDISILS